MWEDTIRSVEGLISALALLITAIGGLLGAWLAIKNITKTAPAKAKNVLEIVQGQVISPEEQWVQDLRDDAMEADELRVKNQILTVRLTKALLRLASNGIPYEDILAE